MHVNEAMYKDCMHACHKSGCHGLQISDIDFLTLESMQKVFAKYDSWKDLKDKETTFV